MNKKVKTKWRQVKRDATSPVENVLPVRVNVAPVKGIDVSYHQKEVNWQQVRGAGYLFAFARATYGMTPDTQFGRNWREMRVNRIFRGAYHFFRPNSDAHAQADRFVDFVAAVAEQEAKDLGYPELYRGDPFDSLPPVIDVEPYPESTAPYWRAHADEIISMVSDVVARVKKRTGYLPIIYTGHAWKYLLNASVKSNDNLGCDLWLAEYHKTAVVPPAWSRWTFWQVTDKRRVPGVATLCDEDLFYGSEEDLFDYVIKAMLRAHANQLLEFKDEVRASVERSRRQ